MAKFDFGTANFDGSHDSYLPGQPNVMVGGKEWEFASAFSTLMAANYACDEWKRQGVRAFYRGKGVTLKKHRQPYTYIYQVFIEVDDCEIQV